MEALRIGLDVAKSVFQVHGVDAYSQAVLRRKLCRSDLLRFFAGIPPWLVGLEACSASHHRAREIGRFGYDVRMMLARHVKPYVQRGKNDVVDAAATCTGHARSSSSRRRCWAT